MPETSPWYQCYTYHQKRPRGTCNLVDMESQVALEGLHALKHAVRFGAHVTDILTDDLERALATADAVAPELRPLLVDRARIISTTRFRELATQPIPTRVLAHAIRPAWRLADALPTPGRPAILLDDPRNSKNLGAVIRVGAAAGAAGLLVNGSADPCDPMAVRGAAGLQWALPCVASPGLLAQLDGVGFSAPGPGSEVEPGPPTPRPGSEVPPGPVTDLTHPTITLIGLDAGGARFDPAAVTGPVVLAFGSERSGLSPAVRERCDRIVALPMRPDVSSLNLATSVAAVLYVMAYAGPRA